MAVNSAAGQAAVSMTAVLGIVQTAICAQHGSGAHLVHLLMKLHHALTLCINRVFAGKVPVVRIITRPHGPEVSPMETAKLVRFHQIHDLVEILLGVGRELALIGLKIGGDDTPTE